MFDLIVTVKRGSASTFRPAWNRYRDIEAAREAASTLLREERVQRVLIVGNEVPFGFVEWQER
jgi:hypothetical protein